jgi:F-type H+-transporting ATPase subunit delta
MASQLKTAQQFARQLFKLSLVDGTVSAERVAGVLEYIETHRPPSPLVILRAYQRMVATELAKGHAVVEHAGPVGEATLAAIAAAMTRKYGRPVTASAKPNPALLAGLRVHVGDDIYESSVSAQLDALATAV